MSTPDITKAQIASVVAALAAVLGVVYQAPERLQNVLLIVLGAIAVAWIFSDAILRFGRSSKAAAESNLAAAQIRALPSDVPQTKP